MINNRDLLAFCLFTSCARGDTICPHPSPPQVGTPGPRALVTAAPASYVKPHWVKWPGDLDHWPSDLESGVRLTCDVGYLCVNFGLLRPLCSRVRPDVHTDVRQKHRLMPLPRGWGYNNCQWYLNIIWCYGYFRIVIVSSCNLILFCISLITEHESLTTCVMYLPFMIMINDPFVSGINSSYWLVSYGRIDICCCSLFIVRYLHDGRT